MTNGLPDNSFVRAVREDPAKKRPALLRHRDRNLFLARHGARWWPLRLNAQGVADAEKAALARTHALAVPADAGRTLADEEPSGLFPIVSGHRSCGQRE